MKRALSVITLVLLLAPFMVLAQGNTTGGQVTVNVSTPASGSTVLANSYNTVTFSNVPYEPYFFIEVLVERVSDRTRTILGNVPIADVPAYYYGWMPSNHSLISGNYKILVRVVDGNQAGGATIAEGYSGVFSIAGNPTVDYVQSPAESKNILHPGERAYVYGTGLSAEYYVQFRDNPNSPDRNYELSDASNFTVPQLPDGWYGLLLSNGTVSSNKISVRISNPTGTTSSVNAPRISSVSPSSVAPGETVTIYGSNFNSATYAFLDSTSAPVLPTTYISPTSIKIGIPSWVSDGTHNLYVAEKASSYPLSNSVFLTVRNNSSVTPPTTPTPPTVTPTQSNEELIKQLQAILQSLIQQLIILLQQQAAAAIISGGR